MAINKNSIEQIDLKLYLGFIIAMNFLFVILLKEYLVTDDLYYEALGEQLSLNRIEKIINLSEKWSWLSYVLVPFILFSKVSFTAICLKIGTIIFNIEFELKKIFRITILAEIIFVIASILKIVLLFINKESLSLEYIQTFYPLSLLNLVVIDNIPQYLIYPLQLINVFELVYWIVLAFLIKIYTNKSFDKSIGFIISTYGAGLFAWVVFVVFLSIN